jgi:hypothetical protein
VQSLSRDRELDPGLDDEATFVAINLRWILEWRSDAAKIP